MSESSMGSGLSCLPSGQHQLVPQRSVEARGTGVFEEGACVARIRAGVFW